MASSLTWLQNAQREIWGRL